MKLNLMFVTVLQRYSMSEVGFLRYELFTNPNTDVLLESPLTVECFLTVGVPFVIRNQSQFSGICIKHWRQYTLLLHCLPCGLIATH